MVSRYILDKGLSSSPVWAFPAFPFFSFPDGGYIDGSVFRHVSQISWRTSTRHFNVPLFLGRLMSADCCYPNRRVEKLTIVARLIVWHYGYFFLALDCSVVLALDAYSSNVLACTNCVHLCLHADIQDPLFMPLAVHLMFWMVHGLQCLHLSDSLKSQCHFFCWNPTEADLSSGMEPNSAAGLCVFVLLSEVHLLLWGCKFDVRRISSGLIIGLFLRVG